MSNIPERAPLKDVSPFRYWCQKVLPLAYDDSMSYYELLCKVVDYINNLGDDLLLMNEDITKLYNYVDNYFTNLDVQEEINNKLDEMALTGELSAILVPIIATKVTGWLEENISTTELPIDASLTVEKAAADAKKTGDIRKNVIGFNSWNILTNMTKVNNNINGVYYEWSGDTCYVHGIARSESYHNILDSRNAIPVGIKQNTKYNVHFNAENVALNILWYSGDTIVRNDYFAESKTFTSPQAFDGMIVRFLVGSGLTVDERISNVYITTADINELIGTFINPIKYKGTLTSGLSIDNIEGQTIYVTPEGTSGAPLTIPGFIMTIGYEDLFKYQIWRAASNGRPYYRYKEPNGAYTNWIDMSETYSDLIGNIRYKGTLPADLSVDDAEGKTIYTVPSATPGIPIATNGFLQTMGYEDGFKYQIWTAASNGRPYYRYKEPNGTYTNWQDSIKVYSTLAKNIFYGESLPSGSDLNDAPPNSVTVDGGNCLNSPEPNYAGYVYTFGDITKGAVVQYWVQYGNGTTHYRRGLNNVWYDWIGSGSGGSGSNPYATMLSVGNSILTGAVYTNGSYNRLATYGNAPYSVVATALDVARENEKHILKSSTGILYDAGEGNFLETIKGIDLSNYDYLLTHFWLADMENYQIGDLTSTANDGTLVGAILEILRYMKSSNGRCQLLLASVPPSSYTISGNVVFTGIYGNGKSISDLDIVMHQLADREHFRYADWQDLNLSYYYQNYTDGNNVHLNSEAGYRTLGEYLSAKLISLNSAEGEIVNVKEVRAVQFTSTTSAAGNVNYQFANQQKVFVVGAYCTRGDTTVVPYAPTNSGVGGNYSWWFNVHQATANYEALANTQVKITILYVEV